MAYGVASWRGLRVSFTDGLCLRCAVRFRREWKLPELKKQGAAFGPAHGLARAAMIVLAAVSFTLAAHPLDDARTRGTNTPPPETVLVPAIPSEEEPMPALSIATRPARTRTNASVIPRAEAPRPTRLARAAIASVAEPSESITPTSPTIVSIAESVVSVVDSRPAVIPPFTMASLAMESAAVEVTVAAVPHAGLTPQAP